MDKYLEKDADSLSGKDFEDIAQHYIEKVLEDALYVSKNFYKKETNDKEWVEFKKGKEFNYLIAVMMAGMLIEQNKRKSSANSTQKYCHECGAQLLK